MHWQNEPAKFMVHNTQSHNECEPPQCSIRAVDVSWRVADQISRQPSEPCSGPGRLQLDHLAPTQR